MNPLPPLALVRCADCHGTFAPRPGACPRCGGRVHRSVAVPPHGRLLAVTQIEYPPPGVSAPHAIGLVELEEGVRLLVRVVPPLPARSSLVEVRAEGNGFLARPSGDG